MENLGIALSKAQQYATIGYAMTVEDFFYKCRQHLNPNWFEDVYLSNIFNELVGFYNRYNFLPRSEHELFSEPFFRALPLSEGEKYYQTIALCKTYTSHFTLEVIRQHLTRFVRVVNSRSWAKNLVAQMNRHNYDLAVQSAEKISSTWREINFDPPSIVDFSDTLSMWLKEDEDENNMMSTGCKHLDELLGGGVERGGNLAVLAPTFTGKSRFLITLARHLLVQKKKVMFILHEDSPQKVKNRIVSALVGVGPKEIKYVLKERYKKLFTGGANPEAEEELKKLNWPNPNLTLEEWTLFKEFLTSQLLAAGQFLQQNFHFLIWQKAGQMFVEDVLAEIKRVHAEMKQKEGRGLDVIIDDYPALLRSHARHEHERARLSYVYQCFNDVAAELGAFCAYAVQVNRNAAKAIKNGDAEKVIGLEDVSESYQIAMNAMSAISLNRTGNDAEQKILRIAVIKARDAQRQGVLVTRSAYNEGSLYGDAKMYTEFGAPLLTGLKNYIVAGQDLSSTDVALRSLLDVENDVTQADLILRSQAPDVVRKLMGFDLKPNPAAIVAAETSVALGSTNKEESEPETNKQ